MTKGYVDYFLETIQTLFTSALAIDPSLLSGLRRDYSRLESLSVKQGLPLFTVLLPACGKVLDQSVDQGFLRLSCIPAMGRINTRTTIPRLFQGIWLKLFDISGRLKEDADPTWLALLRQIYFCGNKLAIDCAPNAVYATVKEYFDVESKIMDVPSIWDDIDHDFSTSVGESLRDIQHGSVKEPDLFERSDPALDSLLSLCQQVADRASTSLGEFSPQGLRFRHGPGATSEFPRGKQFKYCFPSWDPRLEAVFPYDQFGVPNFSVLGDAEYDELPSFSEGCSKLYAVPKTARGPRLIAAEPTSNQWCQQAVLSFLKDSLRRGENYGNRFSFGRSVGSPLGLSIALRDQSLSQAAVLRASRDGSSDSIDLSAASDRLSCWLVHRIFRRNLPLLAAMVACRTRYLYNDIDRKQPSLLKLKKFASMGSALTFPVQSIVFAVISISCLLYSRGQNASHWVDAAREVRVYGDDIIVPCESTDSLLMLLHKLGLKVNPQKTFTKGNFRESCGCDAFKGYDVTPVKIKHFPVTSRPSESISVIDTCNLLHMKGWWHTAEFLRNAVRLPRKNVAMVHSTNGTWGDQTFCRGNGPSVHKELWNHDLQRAEVRLLQPRSKTTRYLDRFSGYANLLQYFTEDPAGSDVLTWESGWTGVSTSGFCQRRVAVSELL